MLSFLTWITFAALLFGSTSHGFCPIPSLHVGRKSNSELFWSASKYHLMNHAVSSSTYYVGADAAVDETVTDQLDEQAVFGHFYENKVYSRYTKPGPQRCFYEVLGLDRHANSVEIKSAYRRLAKLYHPDLCQDERAVEKFQEVNEAYEELIDPNLRKKYDKVQFRAAMHQSKLLNHVQRRDQHLASTHVFFRLVNQNAPVLGP